MGVGHELCAGGGGSFGAGVRDWPRRRPPACLQRWAEVLMQPQLVGQVAPGFAKKVEAISRQPAW